jgi:hypothetical protein
MHRVMKKTIVALAAVGIGALSGLVAPAAMAKTNACQPSEAAPIDLRASNVGCTTARSVAWHYFHSDLGESTLFAAGRTWRCSVRILRNHGYDPAIFGDRVTGRVLCTHVANRGRFVRWQFQGGGD